MKRLKNLRLLSLLWLVTTMTASGTEQGNDLKLTLVYDSPYGFEETLESLRNSIHAHNFRVFPDRYLEEGLVDEFSVNTRQVSVRFCNFSDLHQAIQIEPQVGFDLALEQVQAVLKQHNFTVAHIQKCDGGLKDMGYATTDYKVVFFGRLDEVREFSKTHPELVPLFPFKLAVYADGKDTRFSVLNPAELAPLLDADKALAEQLVAWERDFRAVLNEMETVHVALAD